MGGEYKELGSPGMAKYSARSDQRRVLWEGWGHLCVFLGKVGGGGRKAACGGEGFLANSPVS